MNTPSEAEELQKRVNKAVAAGFNAGYKKGYEHGSKEQAQSPEICEVCDHIVHPLCNNGNCDEPHFDPQNPPEPPDYD
jgi:flagellar biosynthesis/type III secretory pathway protein FliH